MFRSVVSPGFVLVSILIALASGEVNALPSFARQTAMPCSACHVQAFGPGLTPTGRNFKLYGYTDVSEDRTGFIPIAGMIRGSFTHTNSGQPGGAADRFGPNNNATIDEASIFYAGRITSKIGAFVQGTYDGVSNTGALDNTDIRLADYVDLAGSPLVYGVSVNNNPTVQDLWNTTPAWSFPWSSSPLAPTPAA
ncbi:MAG TPA: cytochrome C, partial [Nitrosospira sp.]